MQRFAIKLGQEMGIIYIYIRCNNTYKLRK